MTAIIVWYVIGMVSIIPFMCVAHEGKQEITVGDVISFLTTSCLGPFLLILLVSLVFTYFCTNERPKWESKVIYRKKK